MVSVDGALGRRAGVEDSVEVCVLGAGGRAVVVWWEGVRFFVNEPAAAGGEAGGRGGGGPGSSREGSRREGSRRAG